MEFFLFSCDCDGLVKSGFLGELPFHVGTAAGKQQVCQLFPAGCPVLTVEFADLQRFLVVNPVTGEAVVAAAGYETGPGDGSKIGGAVYEIHKKLGTGHNSTLTFAEMIDQSLEYGPIQCE